MKMVFKKPACPSSSLNDMSPSVTSNTPVGSTLTLHRAAMYGKAHLLTYLKNKTANPFAFLFLK